MRRRRGRLRNKGRKSNENDLRKKRQERAGKVEEEKKSEGYASHLRGGWPRSGATKNESPT